jgi:hypothetical protein
MGFVVRLEGYVPGQRDDQPWTLARINEGPSRTGPWTLLETKALTPVDVDPATVEEGAEGTWINPLERNFTTTLATSPQDWFQVVFADAVGNLQPAPAVYFPNPAMRPSALDVATLLWARTKTAGGQTTGVFDATTRPTATQVEMFIDAAVEDVVGRTGTVPERLWGMAREAAKVRTAMSIEVSFRPEQASEAGSAYSLLRNDWLDLMGGGPSGTIGRLVGAVALAGLLPEEEAVA